MLGLKPLAMGEMEAATESSANKKFLKDFADDRVKSDAAGV